MEMKHILPSGRRLARLFLLGLSFTAALFGGAAQAQTAVVPPGDGLTTGTAYQISQLGHLVWMGDTVTSSSGRYYTMTADINASGTADWNDAGTDSDLLEGFAPIGGSTSPDTSSFRGVFDGAGHEVSGLTISRPATDRVGLFGRVGTGGVVMNVSLEAGTIAGSRYVGALVGSNNGGTIANCGSATPVVCGTAPSHGACVGGLVGLSIGEITSCSAAGNVTGAFDVGGLVGQADGAVTNCFATGAATGTDFVGGLVGSSSATLARCYATGGVNSARTAGGLVCRNTGFIATCAATGMVRTENLAGGLVGDNHGAVSDSFASGATGGFHAAGLVGDNYGSIARTYATGASAFATIEGGLVIAGFATATDSYWDIWASGRGNSTGGTGKTTTEMRQQATFANWDFSAVWGISEGRNYPYLRGLPHYALTYIAGPNGSVGGASSMTQALNTFAAGTAVAAAPDSGYHFTGWSDGRTDNPRTDPKPSVDLTVTAYFAPGAPTATPTATPTLTSTPTATPTATLTPTSTPTATPTNTPRPGQNAVVPPGNGLTTSTAYQISQLGHLVWMGETVTSSSGKYYRLMNDIDASDTANWRDGAAETELREGFRPIGAYARLDPPDAYYFRGVFDGGEHLISGLHIQRCEDWMGLFGQTGPEAVIRDLELQGSVEGGHCAGSLVGFNRGLIEGCSAAVAVSLGGNSNGGLVGGNSGTIANCSASGTVQGDCPVGGLAGSNSRSGIITNCHASGRVTANWYRAGGLVGDNDGVIVNCYATGEATAMDYVGGLVGGTYSHGSVMSCYATGAAAGGGGVGGLAGESIGSSIANSFAIGAVTGDKAGGLVGICSNSRLVNNHAAGRVTGGSTGGLFPAYFDAPNTVTRCYWDTQATSQSVSAGGEGKTTAQMKQANSFVAWDFSSVWGIREGETRPWLRAFSYSLRYSAGPNGSLEGATSQTVRGCKSGTAVRAKPVGGWHFVGWSDGRTDNPRVDVFATADIDVVASFSLTSTVPPGDGITADTAFQISQLGHLVWMGENVGGSNAKYYKLMNDLDASATADWSDAETGTDLKEGFRPIGDPSDIFRQTAFRGYFDGGGHTIMGLTINRPDTDYVGLFGYVWAGSVTNLGLEGGSVRGRDCVGALAGADSGSVLGCYATATVLGGGDKVGGLIGWSLEGGSVENCFATGAVTGRDFVGGLIGSNEQTLSCCYAAGRITGGGGASCLGGLTGASGALSASKSFFNTETSGQTAATGDGAMGKTTAQMCQQATFTGWDFANVWGIAEGQNYPHLRAFGYRLTYSAGPGGSITGETAQTVRRGQSGTMVTAKRDNGFHFVQWSDGRTSNPRTDRNVTGDLGVTANFAMNPASVGRGWEKYR